ncbi:hypothetical protein C2E31_09670 [Rhodopirellula baltica]|nr:hypothetical protein C2E31_09670 [Rhodopirellula baltica]
MRPAQRILKGDRKGDVDCPTVASNITIARTGIVAVPVDLVPARLAGDVRSAPSNDSLHQTAFNHD